MARIVLIEQSFSTWGQTGQGCHASWSGEVVLEEVDVKGDVQGFVDRVCPRTLPEGGQYYGETIRGADEFLSLLAKGKTSTGVRNTRIAVVGDAWAPMAAGKSIDKENLAYQRMLLRG